MKSIKKNFGYLLLLVLMPCMVLGQVPTQTIRGVVKDRDSKTPLVGVSIILKNTDPLVGAITDLNGAFEIADVPIGRTDDVDNEIIFRGIHLSRNLFRR